MSRWYRPCCTIRCPSSVSVLGRGSTHSPGLNLALDSARTTAYVLYAIVFQETSVRHTRARTLFVLLPRSCRLSSAVISRIVRPPSSSSRNFTRITLHLAPVSRAVGSYSRRFERTRDDTVSPFLPLPFASILSRPPSFYSLDVSSREEKNSRSAANRSYDDHVAALRSAKNRCSRENSRVTSASLFIHFF